MRKTQIFPRGRTKARPYGVTGVSANPPNAVESQTVYRRGVGGGVPDKFANTYTRRESTGRSACPRKSRETARSVIPMKQVKHDKYILLAILALAALARLWRFGAVPGGLNQDEAFAAYEAWALLHHGVDSSLHAWPVYLTAWGSGMNALESYLLIPLLALFGVRIWVIRLPQLLLALASIPAAWALGKRIAGKTGAVLFALALALCPWHVMLSRWALESNLAPGLLLIGLCLFLRGREDSRFLPPAALVYGLSLYAYSAIWPVMPALLLLLGLYLRPKRDRRLWLSLAILAALALPLLAFLAVNLGWIGEFSLGPFSVPKLVRMRASEISLRAVPENARNLLHILLTRSDGLIWNTPERGGLFYPLFLPLALIGLAALCVRFARSLWARRFDPAGALLIWTLLGLCQSLLISVNANRMNFLLLPLVLCEALGASTLLRVLKKRETAALLVVAGIWIGMFVPFALYYFTDYDRRVRGEFTWGVEQAIPAALAHEGTVYVTKALSYPKLLLFSETPPRDFAGSVTYEAYPAYYLSPRSFTRFRFYDDAAMPKDENGVYILWAGTDASPWLARGFSMEQYGVFRVLWRE